MAQDIISLVVKAAAHDGLFPGVEGWIVVVVVIDDGAAAVVVAVIFCRIDILSG